MAIDLYSLFQVSETNEMIILVVLLIMFFAIIFDIFMKLKFFNKMTSAIIAGIISLTALLSGMAIKTVHVITALASSFGAIGIFGLVALMFVAFILLHFGFTWLAKILMRRR